MTMPTAEYRKNLSPLRAMACALAIASVVSVPTSVRRVVSQASSSLKAAGENAETGAPVASALSTPNFAASAIAIRHWSKPQVTVRVIASDLDNKTPDQVSALVDQGLGLWNGRFKNVTLKQTTAVDADVTVTFVQPGALPGGAVGRTDSQFDPETNEISHATVQLNLRMPRAEMVQAVGHEMGHVLGIQGHSTNKGDLMYPYAHLPVEVTDRDLNTLNIGYTTAARTPQP